MTKSTSRPALVLQPASEDIWDKKYRLKTKAGEPIDVEVQDSFARVAHTLAALEKDPKKWEERFLWAMSKGAIPAGRIMSNAGAQEHKPATSLINCLAGDTQVLTIDGLRPISELAGQKVRVLNGNNRWVDVNFQSYGVQQTYGLRFRHGQSRNQNAQVVRATAGHRWILDSGKVITTEYWLTGTHNRNHTTLNHLMAPRPDRENPAYAKGVFHGMMFGDGHKAKDSPDRFVMDLVEAKAVLAPWVERELGKEGLPTRYNEQGNTGLRWNFRSQINWKELPAEGADSSYILGFFAGILATDGSVFEGGKGTSYVSLYGAESLLRYMQRHLPVVGITPQHLVLSLSSLQHSNFGQRLKDVWTLSIHPATVDLNDVLRPEHIAKFHPTARSQGLAGRWSFEGVVPESVRMEEVFCCQEDETQSFAVLSGLQTGNCTVSGHIQDSMDDIMRKAHESALTLRAGCGIGYEFSTLRPKGAFVAGAGANTSGPLSFMDIYDAMCFTVASAGGRRGAQMGTFDVSHPDVRDFIRAKRENGRLRQFNLSLLITDDFMKAVESDGDWPLVFPLHEKEMAEVNLDDPQQVVWREWAIHDKYIVREGLVACRVHKVIKARNLWETIMASTYDFAEPGFILIDKSNEMNNNWWCEDIRATNPCGEQNLPEYGSCLLGSINLTSFVRAPFTAQARFDWDEYQEVVAVFTRMLDNVVEINGLPLERQREEIYRKRRHGMGFLGLGSTMTMLGMPYGSSDSVAFTEEVSKVMAIVGWEQALALTQEKGPAPIMDEDFEVTDAMLRKRPEMARDGLRLGDKVAGRVLHARYSRYMQRIAEVRPDLVRELARVGARFTHHSSIAPTGTIALSFGNNVSNGIEPSFAHHYSRNVIREGKKSKEKVEVFSYELLAYRQWVDPKAMPYPGESDTALPDYFITADSVTPKQHVDVQAASQKWVDSSISKTANVPTDYPYEDFKDIYLYAYQKGLKGCTTFRFNPSAFQGVLVKESDLENTLYRFELEDGSIIEVKGNEQIEYDGEMHSAANLFDALKEGYYGKF